jgi:hypothetical protein
VGVRIDPVGVEIDLESLVLRGDTVPVSSGFDFISLGIGHQGFVETVTERDNLDLRKFAFFGCFIIKGCNVRKPEYTQ